MSKKYTNGKDNMMWWILGISFLVAGLIIWAMIVSGNQFAKLSNRQVALICTTDMTTRFHIHPQLKIIINGVGQEIPANIGISFGCMHPIHTHDATGILHVESPIARDFTLGDFFAVWEKPFSKDQILDYKIDNSHSILVSVNGKVVDTYENTILRDKDQIIIQLRN